jgi:uncharacterized membrane protein/protein-disulfide isomerase
MNNKKDITPLPFVYYYVPVFMLSALGLFASLYLSVSHYRVYTDVTYSSFCAISKAINCDTVSQSPYSVFIGIPVPIWGILGYLFFLVGLTYSGLRDFRPCRLWRLLFIVAAGFSLISILLAAVSSFVIHSYCIMCIVTYAVNFALLFYTWLIPRRYGLQGFSSGLKKDWESLKTRNQMMWGWMGGFALILFSSWWLIPAYWQFSPPAMNSDINSGYTEDGHPWIGSASPEMTIVEFTDYQCFQCKKMHFHLRKLLNRYPQKIRLIHRHYPMDHGINPIVQEPFHEGSGMLSLLAIQAGLKGKFWEANDVLYHMGGQSSSTIDIAELAARIGLDPDQLVTAFKDPVPFKKLLSDIRAGMRLFITGTPSYVIDGTVYESQIPANILSNILSEHTTGKIGVNAK